MGAKGQIHNSRFTPNFKELDRMLESGGTGVQAAARFGVHPETLYDSVKRETGIDFSAYKREKQSSGEMLLKQAQFINAMQGNSTLQIWLGKQMLGQKDNPDAEHEFNGQLSQFLDKLMKLDAKLKEKAALNDGSIEPDTDRLISEQ